MKEKDKFKRRNVMEKQIKNTNMQMSNNQKLIICKLNFFIGAHESRMVNCAVKTCKSSSSQNPNNVKLPSFFTFPKDER